MRPIRRALDDLVAIALTTLIVAFGAVVGLVFGLAKYGPSSLRRVLKKRL